MRRLPMAITLYPKFDRIMSSAGIIEDIDRFTSFGKRAGKPIRGRNWC